MKRGLILFIVIALSAPVFAAENNMAGSAVRSLLDEVWDGVAGMRLSEAFAALGEQDLEDFAALGEPPAEGRNRRRAPRLAPIRGPPGPASLRPTVRRECNFGSV